MASRTRVRGVVAGSYVTWLRETFGEETFAAVLEHVSVPTRERFRNGLFPTAWAPFDEWNELLEAAASVVAQRHGVDRQALERRSVREAGGKIIATFYRLVLPLVKPSGALRRMPLLHGRTFENSRCELLGEGEREVTLRFFGDHDLLAYFRRTSPLVLAYIAESAGAKSVAVQTTDSRISSDGFAVDMRVQWS